MILFYFILFYFILFYYISFIYFIAGLVLCAIKWSNCVQDCCSIYFISLHMKPHLVTKIKKNTFENRKSWPTISAI